MRYKLSKLGEVVNVLNENKGELVRHHLVGVKRRDVIFPDQLRENIAKC